MKKFLKVSKFFIKMIPALIGAYFGWVLRYSINPEKHPFEVRYAKFRKLMLKVAKTTQLNLKTENLDLLNNVEPGSLIIGNHQSAMDIVIIGALSERPLSFVAKKETKKLPIVGKCIKILGGVFLDRNDAIQAVKCFKIAQDNMEKGISYVIYPEGTRNKMPLSTDVGPFHSGSFRLGLKAEKGILVFSSFGQFRVLSNECMYKSYLTQFKFLEFLPASIFKEKSTNDIAEDCRTEINNSINEMKLVDKEYIDNKSYKTKAPKWWKK